VAEIRANPILVPGESWYLSAMVAHGPSRIPARNRRETMDWALVLASQGINALIDDGADGAGWGLVVSAEDYPRALRAIRLYRWENRHWDWHQPMAWHGLIFDWKAIFWGLFLAGCYWLTHVLRPDFQSLGCMNNAAVRAGEWWRLFSAILLHADPGHLASNVSLGILLLGLAMGRFGAGLALLATYLAGAAGNLAGLFLYPPAHLGVGASGMVMGALGMLAAQSVVSFRRNPLSRRNVIRTALAGLMLFVLFGLNPEADVVAHLGGFATGFWLGGMLMWRPAAGRAALMNLVAGAVALLLLVGTSWLAFR
jgi:membrane associated rhomboid family serine protease